MHQWAPKNRRMAGWFSFPRKLIISYSGIVKKRNCANAIAQTQLRKKDLCTCGTTKFAQNAVFVQRCDAMEAKCCVPFRKSFAKGLRTKNLHKIEVRSLTIQWGEHLKKINEKKFYLADAIDLLKLTAVLLILFFLLIALLLYTFKSENKNCLYFIIMC